MNGLTAPVGEEMQAPRTSLKVALPDPAMRMRRMMTRPGSSSTGCAPILPSTTTVACLRARTQTFAKRAGDDVLQHDVDALLGRQPPHLAR